MLLLLCGCKRAWLISSLHPALSFAFLSSHENSTHIHRCCYGPHGKFDDSMCHANNVQTQRIEFFTVFGSTCFANGRMKYCFVAKFKYMDLYFSIWQICDFINFSHKKITCFYHSKIKLIYIRLSWKKFYRPK